jgi:hypothetical protein
MGLYEGFKTSTQSRESVDEHTAKTACFGVLQHALAFWALT